MPKAEPPSERSIENFLNTLPAVLYEYALYKDGSREVIYLSPTSSEILEHEPEYFMADMGHFIEMIHPADLERFIEEDVRANQAGEVFCMQLRVILPSGLEKWLQLSSRPTPHTKKDAVIWSGYIIDITSQKQLELAHQGKLQKARESLATLTPREREIFEWVVTGRPNKTIAHELGISEKTVKIHRGQVVKKMQADSLANLVRTADLLGLS